MASGLETVILMALAGLTAAIGFRFMWIRHRLPRPRSTRPAVDPITGVKDQVVIYDTAGPLIAMPSHLKTRDEMVSWMTTELPKLTAEMQKPHT